MWIIAGLGNPGRKYAGTRHNIGFMVINEVAQRHDIELTKKREYKIGRGSIKDQRVVLVEPLLYMNLSGIAIYLVLKKFFIPPENLIVVHDDLDMDMGNLRIRRTGSSGGHRGIESIIQNIDSKDFIRLKIGIGRQEEIPAEEYVLNKFSRSEKLIVKNSISKAADAITSVITEGVDKAMNKFN